MNKHMNRNKTFKFTHRRDKRTKDYKQVTKGDLYTRFNSALIRAHPKP